MTKWCVARAGERLKQFTGKKKTVNAKESFNEARSRKPEIFNKYSSNPGL